MMVRLFSRDAVAKFPCTCGSLPGIYRRGDDGSNHERFVNIYTAAGWEYDFHNKTSSVKIARRMQGLNRQAINRC